MSNTVARLAASILGVGENRIWLDPSGAERVRDALTRDDVRGLIKDGLVKAKRAYGVSRARARKKQEGKRKGRRRGMGSRRGTRNAREGAKKKWMAHVRLQRRTLSELSKGGKIVPADYRRVYNMIKGGAFRGKAALLTYLKEKIVKV